MSSLPSSSPICSLSHAIHSLQCLKESYVKAIGTGIGFSLQRLDFHVHSPLDPGKYITDTKVRTQSYSRAVFLQNFHDKLSSCFSESLVAPCCQIYVDGKLDEDWVFQETMIDSRHCVAVALHKVFDL